MSIGEILQVYGEGSETREPSLSLALANTYMAGIKMEAEALKAYGVAEEAIQKLKDAYDVINQLKSGDTTPLLEQLEQQASVIKQQQNELVGLIALLRDPNRLCDYIQRLEFELGELPEVQKFRKNNPNATYEDFKKFRLNSNSAQSAPQLPLPNGTAAPNTANGVPAWMAIRQVPFHQLFAE